MNLHLWVGGVHIWIDMRILAFAVGVLVGWLLG